MFRVVGKGSPPPTLLKKHGEHQPGFELLDVVHHLVQRPLADPSAARLLQWRLVIAVDGTNLWQVQATRGDVYVDTGAAAEVPTQPLRWATWWAMTGGDTSAALQALDNAAQLNRRAGGMCWRGSPHCNDCFTGTWE